jgi:hypothetical protein
LEKQRRKFDKEMKQKQKDAERRKVRNALCGPRLPHDGKGDRFVVGGRGRSVPKCSERKKMQNAAGRKITLFD